MKASSLLSSSLTLVSSSRKHSWDALMASSNFPSSGEKQDVVKTKRSDVHDRKMDFKSQRNCQLLPRVITLYQNGLSNILPQISRWHKPLWILSSLTQQIQNCSMYVQVASWEKRSFFLSTVVLGNGVKEQPLLTGHLLCLAVLWKGIVTLSAELFSCHHDQLVGKELQAVRGCREPPVQPENRT